jgi:hypothetical protein
LDQINLDHSITKNKNEKLIKPTNCRNSSKLAVVL